MRNGWFGGFLAVMLMMVGTAPGADDPPAEDAKLAAFFRAYLDASFRAEPLTATRLGDHRFDDQLDDLSPAGPRRPGRRSTARRWPTSPGPSTRASSRATAGSTSRSSATTWNGRSG